MRHGKEVPVTPSVVGNEAVVAFWVEGDEDFPSEKGDGRGSSTLTSFCSTLVPSVTEAFFISKLLPSSLPPLPCVFGASTTALETSNKQENTYESNHRIFLFYKMVFIRSYIQ